MKRLFLVLIVLLLFTGCQQRNKMVDPASEPPKSSLNVSFVQNSSIEKESDGAICMYAVSGNACGIESIDTGIVIYDDQGRMARLSSGNALFVPPEFEAMQLLSAYGKNIIGYVAESREIVVMNDQFGQTARFTLEEGIVGDPIVGEDTHEIYYCVDEYIRALSLDTGLTRHVIQHVQEGPIQIRSCFGGEIIAYDSQEKSTYISSVDGQTVFHDSDLRDFQTGSDRYYGVFTDGFVDQVIWGALDGEPLQLLFPEQEVIYPQLDENCVITVQDVEDKKILRRYDMQSGLCVSRVNFAINDQIIDITVDDAYTWLLTSAAVYRWDNMMSAVSEKTVYTIDLITAENPDAEAIEECKKRADEIGQEYGIKVLVWDDAILNDSTYSLIGEYQILPINSMLDGLELHLANMPEKIFTSTKQYYGFTVCLVRSVEALDYVQFWTDDGLCIAITPAADIQEALLTGLGWAIDSRVIGNSRDLDYWNTLNPDGFNYDYSYFVNAQRTDLQYLEGENRAFTDQRAMSFPSEDRARIFYYSLLEGNEDMFASPIMQTKLKAFFEGIREAYGWQKEAESFPWEQYFDESLAYTK